MSAFNDQVIADFNSHGGKPGGYFKDAPVLLLHATGAKSGIERTQPLMFMRDGEGPWFIFASYGGGPKDPAWFNNLVFHPDAAISVGDDTTIERVPVLARVLDGAECDAIYAEQAKRFPQFGRYAEETTRDIIPVIELTPR